MKKYILLFLIILGASAMSYANEMGRDTTKTKLYLAKDCSKADAIYVIISQAIEAGAPTYNAGNHLGCYMIYEGAAYKILHKYGARCDAISNLLEATLEKCSGDYSATDKAWLMRMAFDQILGEPTQTK